MQVQRTCRLTQVTPWYNLKISKTSEDVENRCVIRYHFVSPTCSAVEEPAPMHPSLTCAERTARSPSNDRYIRRNWCVRPEIGQEEKTKIEVERHHRTCRRATQCYQKRQGHIMPNRNMLPSIQNEKLRSWTKLTLAHCITRETR